MFRLEVSPPYTERAIGQDHLHEDGEKFQFPQALRYVTHPYRNRAPSSPTLLKKQILETMDLRRLRGVPH